MCQLQIAQRMFLEKKHERGWQCLSVKRAHKVTGQKGHPAAKGKRKPKDDIAEKKKTKKKQKCSTLKGESEYGGGAGLPEGHDHPPPGRKKKY